MNKAVTASRTRGAVAGSRDDLDSPTGITEQSTPSAPASRYANYGRSRDRSEKTPAQELLSRLQDKPTGTAL